MMISIFDSQFIFVYCIVVAICLGACMGSFLNCAAWRIVHGESFLSGRSHCPNCGHTLTAVELIPIISWLIQKGRCKNCKTKISVRYPLTEILFAVITILCLLRFDLTVLCLRNYIFICCLFLISLTDIDSMIIPDGCHIVSIVTWFMALPFLFTGWMPVLFSVLSAFLIGGGLLLISFIMDKKLGMTSMGGGDIKLFFVVGLYLGFVGTLFALILSCVIGLLFKVIFDRKNMAKAFPFGPAIAISTMVMLLYGEPFVRWYMGFIVWP